MVDEHCYHNFMAIARKRRVESSMLKVEMSKTFRIHRLKAKTMKYVSVDGRRRQHRNISPKFIEMSTPLRITIFFFVPKISLTMSN